MLAHAKMQRVVDSYIQAYNALDVDGMIACLHPEVRFVNHGKEGVNLETRGLDEFRAAAEQACGIFSSRRMTPLGYHFGIDVTSLLVDFQGVLAVDLPGGPVSGETLELRGESIFTFRDDQIVEIVDRPIEAPPLS